MKHVRHDFNLGRETEDDEIYNFVTKEKRIIITHDKGFRKQLKLNGTGILVIPSYLSNKEIGELLCDFISLKNPNNFIGKETKL